MITDSTGRGLNYRRLSRDQSYFVKKLSKGKDISDAKDYIERTRLTPKTVVINVGTNNLAREDIATTKAGLMNLITVTRTRFSTTRILYSPILPRIGDSDFNNNARKVNAGIKQHCDQTDNCGIVHQDKLWDIRTRGKLYHYDGVHLNPTGTASLATAFKNAVTGQQTSEPQRTQNDTAWIVPPTVRGASSFKESTASGWNTAAGNVGTLNHQRQRGSTGRWSLTAAHAPSNSREISKATMMATGVTSQWPTAGPFVPSKSAPFIRGNPHDMRAGGSPFWSSTGPTASSEATSDDKINPRTTTAVSGQITTPYAQIAGRGKSEPSPPAQPGSYEGKDYTPKQQAFFDALLKLTNDFM